MLEVEKHGKINIIFLLLLFILTIGIFTSESFVSSYMLQNFYLSITIIGFFIYYLLKNKLLFITSIELLWCAFLLYFIIRLFLQSEFMLIYVVDCIVFLAFILLFLMLKININYYIVLMKLIVIITFLYAIGSFLQYFNMELYSKLILPYFSENQKTELLMLYVKGSYTGFTWQTAFVSGYLICGIGIILLSYKYLKQNIYKLMSLGMLLVMLPALFLGGKRAHLLFMLIALIITHFVTSFNKRWAQGLIKYFPVLVITGIGGFLFIKNYVPDIDTPFGKLYYRFYTTFEDLNTGNDITSGRSELYTYAFKLFSDNPIIGIGWREFSQVSKGLIHVRIGSHPHNIYIQLLAELGIVGFVLFIVPIIYTLYKTIYMLLKGNTLFQNDVKWKLLLRISLYYQVFFILYGLTGNLLTDHMYLLIYLLLSTITYSAIYNVKQYEL